VTLNIYVCNFRLEFLLYMCMYMLVFQREDLLKGEFSSNLRLLQSYPPTDLQQLLEGCVAQIPAYVEPDSICNRVFEVVERRKTSIHAHTLATKTVFSNAYRAQRLRNQDNVQKRSSSRRKSLDEQAYASCIECVPSCVCLFMHF
jgi:hypothetical protein